MLAVLVVPAVAHTLQVIALAENATQLHVRQIGFDDVVELAHALRAQTCIRREPPLWEYVGEHRLGSLRPFFEMIRSGPFVGMGACVANFRLSRGPTTPRRREI
mgnify:CR=1 FL=1